MTVLSPSLLVGVSSLPYLCPPRIRSNRYSKFGNCPGCVPTRASFQFQQLGQRRFPTLLAIGMGSPQAVGRKRLTLGSKSRKSVSACNAASNARCSQGQTQTVTREAPTITKAPVHEKVRSPKLDDGGSGFPPRDNGGGGGGGGGGGENFSGGFFLFGFLLFMGFLKDLESKHDQQSGHGR